MEISFHVYLPLINLSSILVVALILSVSVRISLRG
jgi:hypothetical protein